MTTQTLEQNLATERQTLESLIDRKSAIGKQARDLEREKESLAHKAHALGDASALERLDAANNAIVRAQLQSRDLEAAAQTQRGIIANTESALAAERDRQAALVAIEKIADARRAATQVARNLTSFVGSLKKLNEAIDEASASGAGFPTNASMELNLRRAIDTSLMPVRLNGDFVRPNDRVSVGEIVGGWLATAEYRLKTQSMHTDDARAA